PTHPSSTLSLHDALPIYGRVLWVTQDAWHHGSMAPNGNLYGNHFISYTNSIIIQPSIDDWDPNAPMMTRQGAHHNIGNICPIPRSEEHTSELQSRENLVC